MSLIQEARRKLDEISRTKQERAQQEKAKKEVSVEQTDSKARALAMLQETNEKTFLRLKDKIKEVLKQISLELLDGKASIGDWQRKTRPWWRKESYRVSDDIGHRTETEYFSYETIQDEIGLTTPSVGLVNISFPIETGLRKSEYYYDKRGSVLLPPHFETDKSAIYVKRFSDPKDNEERGREVELQGPDDQIIEQIKALILAEIISLHEKGL